MNAKLRGLPVLFFAVAFNIVSARALNGTYSSGTGTINKTKPEGGHLKYPVLLPGTGFSDSAGIISGMSATVSPSAIYAAGPYNARGTAPVAVTAAIDVFGLTSLIPGVGKLSPAFGATVYNYTDIVPSNAASMTITPNAGNTNAIITVNGVVVTSGNASPAIPLSVGSNAITIVVLGPGVETETYTITVTRVPPTDANLSALRSNAAVLSPAFDGGTTAYTVFAGPVSTITLIPTAEDRLATIKVNGNTVMSGAASPDIPISIGSNTIIVVVTAADGVTSKTYSITVYGGAKNAALANLVIPTPTGYGNLIPFNYTTTNYTLLVDANSTIVAVTPTAADGNATISLDGTVVQSGIGWQIPIHVGQNTITVVVTAQNGFTTNTYTVVVTRPLSSVATLSALVISSGKLSPAFAPGTNNYSVVLPAAITAVKITPTLTDASASVKVNGTAVAKGTASAAIPLDNGKSTITVAITAQDGFDMDTYTITVYKGATNDALSNLKLSHGTLSPVFNYQTLNYGENVSNVINSIKITPTAADANATITVNGTPVASKSASQPVSLVVGVNPIIITVTAQNGITYQSYDVAVSRAAASDNSVYQPASVEQPQNHPTVDGDIVSVRQGVSPNGDGVNDFLVIDGILAYPDNHLSIMNRNGQLIFEAKGYDNSSKLFDGHSNKNGQMQLPGTYFYELDYTLAGITIHKTGFIVLKY